MTEELKQYVVSIQFVVENTSYEAAQKEVRDFIEQQLKGLQGPEPIDAEFREIGRGE